VADDTVYVNFQEGVKRLMNNANLYIKLLGKFKNDINLSEIEEAIAAGDLEKAQAVAHTVKGIAANLSLTELFNASLKLETQIKAGNPDPEQVEILKTVYETTLQEVEKVIAKNGQ